MRRNIDLPLSPHGVCIGVILIAIVSLQGCAVMNSIRDKSRPFPLYPEESLERRRFALVPGSDVIGRLAVIKVKNGDTLPDIARHFSLGINEISAANPDVDIWVPKAGRRIMLPMRFILPDAPRKGIVINLAAMRLFQFRTENNALVVWTYPVGIGTTERPTPTGQMYVERKVTRPTWYVPASISADYRQKGDPLPPEVLPGPLNPLGDYALYLSKSTYLVHGTNKPYSIGLTATNGCIRLYPEDIDELYGNTPVGTPVCIVNQPYLVGERNEIVYLEAHTPLEGTDEAEREKIYTRLKNIEKRAGRALDWKKINAVLSEARGIPVPIFEFNQGRWAAPTIEIKHPVTLYGQPEVPRMKRDAWYVLATSTRDEIDALRMAAIINHQGPQIPARVKTTSEDYRVIAGPFNSIGEAKDAARRLKIDLELDGIVMEPVKKK